MLDVSKQMVNCFRAALQMFQNKSYKQTLQHNVKGGVVMVGDNTP